MENRFALNLDQLAEVSTQFVSGVRQGLSEEGQEIRCLLTFVPTTERVPDGEALVVDLGGTRIRAALVKCRLGVLEVQGQVQEALLPIRRGLPLSREAYLAAQVDVVRGLSPPAGLPLGYCFSYPAASAPDGDARLIRWTKGVNIPDVEGHRVGAMLRNALEGAGIPTGQVVVLNDTVAALLAGLSGPRADHYAGLIVGTGNNLALLLPPTAIPRFPSIPWAGPVPVNLESGNFTPPFLTEFDDAVDAGSDNPGRQRFEKAVSGVYLGHLLKHALPRFPFDAQSGSVGVSRAADGVDCNAETAAMARAILNRSADLVAATLSGTAELFSPAPGATVRVVAEGGLFWGAPGYQQRVLATLNRLLRKAGRSTTSIEITSAPSANLLGAAAAALSR